MDFLQRNAKYQSGLDKLFTELKHQNPSFAEDQRKGMALLWDKKLLNVEERRRDNRTRLKQPAYVYR